jgi:hypothetical protein
VGVEVQFQEFLFSALEVGGHLAVPILAESRGKISRYPLHIILGPRDDLDVLGKRKSRFPLRIELRFVGSPARSTASISARH